MSDPELEYVVSQIGPEAKATGRIRVATCEGQARFQQKWVGPFGSLWLEIPMVEVPYLPPHSLKLKCRSWAMDATELAE